MNEKLKNYWEMLKAVSPYLMIFWCLVLLTVIVLRATQPEVLANADLSYWGFLGSLVSLIAVPVLFRFKK